MKKVIYKISILPYFCCKLNQFYHYVWKYFELIIVTLRSCLSLTLSSCDQSIFFSHRPHSHTEEFWWDRIDNKDQQRILYLLNASCHVVAVKIHVSSLIFMIGLFWWNGRGMVSILFITIFKYLKWLCMYIVYYISKK